MCVQDCRTFLWGGTGEPAHDPAGACFCVCDDDGWSDANILGRASCVPEKAHQIFAWLGLAVSFASLCHAVYHLIRQIMFHAKQPMSSSLPVERCRRDMHGMAIFVHLLGLGYFVMVIENKLGGSAIMLAASGSPHFMCSAVIAGRMWIYTNDPRLMRESPKVVAIASWLERPTGQCLAFAMVSFGPLVATVLAAAGKTETSMKAAAVGVALLAVGTGRTFWICGLALIEAIDESLQKRQQQHDMQKASEAEGGERYAANSGSGSGVDPMLSSAKRKVKRMMIFTTTVCVGTWVLSFFIVFSEYATAAPLPFYAAPLLLASITWIAVNIQLHAGRTKLRDSRPGRLASAARSLPEGLRSKCLGAQVLPVTTSAP